MRAEDIDFLTGEWTIAPQRNLLVRGSDEVRVEPRVMDVLVCLAERAGQVVSKDELVARVWEGRHVTDDVLTVAIYALRKALGDDARRPRYLETVSRRGYRWIAPVTRSQDPRPASAARRIVWGNIAAVLALAALAAGATWILRPSLRSRHVASAESHEAYVKGRYFLDQRSIQGWRQALEHFERAVALDPQDPAAHAGLADTYSAMSDFGVASPAELRPRAMLAARRALELDPDSAEGHEALGRARFLFDWDFPSAERSLQRAIQLNPELMPACQALAWLRSAQGRHREAAGAARRALQLDPVNTARYTELAWVLVLGGQHHEALREVDRALALNPRSFQPYLTKGWACEVAGQPDAAFAAYRDGWRLAGAPDDAIAAIEAVYRAEGIAGFYRYWLERQRRSGGGPLSETWQAQLHVRAGQPDLAIAALDRARQKREGALAWVHVEPAFHPLRSDPRFQQIAAQVGQR